MKTIIYRIIEYSTRTKKEIIDKEIREAFNRWEQAFGLKFEQWQDGKGGHISILFKDINFCRWYNKNYDVLAFYNTNFPDTIFVNDGYGWSGTFEERIKEIQKAAPDRFFAAMKCSLTPVMTHEIGHLFRIPHTENPEDIMYKHCNMEDKEFSKNDLKQIQEVLCNGY